MLRARVDALLEFWFGAEDSATYGKSRAEWYRKDARFDDACRAQFERDLQAAARGEWEPARDDARGALALTILLDQIPRNLYRQSPRAFAFDAQALEVAKRAVEAGLDSQLPTVLRRFLYMPFEHSEALVDQRRSVELQRSTVDALGGEGAVDYALRHLKIVERFGRFPHRNEVLGRASTDEERKYLEGGGRPLLVRMRLRSLSTGLSTDAGRPEAIASWFRPRAQSALQESRTLAAHDGNAGGRRAS